MSDPGSKSTLVSLRTIVENYDPWRIGFVLSKLLYDAHVPHVMFGDNVLQHFGVRTVTISFGFIVQGRELDRARRIIADFGWAPCECTSFLHGTSPSDKWKVPCHWDLGEWGNCFFYLLPNEEFLNVFPLSPDHSNPFGLEYLSYCQPLTAPFDYMPAYLAPALQRITGQMAYICCPTLPSLIKILMLGYFQLWKYGPNTPVFLWSIWVDYIYLYVERKEHPLAPYLNDPGLEAAWRAIRANKMTDEEQERCLAITKHKFCFQKSRPECVA